MRSVGMLSTSSSWCPPMTAMRRDPVLSRCRVASRAPPTLSIITWSNVVGTGRSPMKITGVSKVGPSRSAASTWMRLMITPSYMLSRPRERASSSRSLRPAVCTRARWWPRPSILLESRSASCA
ncbi:hypothetical protein D7319_23780 [Streptomyces radicis]|uniref:Uncharacterized protein n=1 Tax=Streptomyces radicis TaxID=1750517 RepID=A0A3A9VYH7_9ACTN|nr:hypothetical protein D7319_23780 [Streptomyces radicis]RKN17711.1 hypothetical protein D7318_22930 [Streptomyces radicis]